MKYLAYHLQMHLIHCQAAAPLSLARNPYSPVTITAHKLHIQRTGTTSNMANVRDSDTSLWLHNKLGTSNDSWTGSSICSQLNAEVLRNIKDCFPDLQTQVKLKLLLSFFHIPRRNVEEVSHQHSSNYLNHHTSLSPQQITYYYISLIAE